MSLPRAHPAPLLLWRRRGRKTMPGVKMHSISLTGANEALRHLPRFDFIAVFCHNCLALFADRDVRILDGK